MPDQRYGFGRNWQAYLSRTFSEERLAIASDCLLAFLGLPDMAGLSFLDIGSGSGLHSLAAVRAGAAKVVSFDFDPNSVAATRHLHRYAGEPKVWQVLEGSVLDGTFMAGLGRFDIVYAWGVLHHTGDQWRALAHAADCVSDQGRFYLALYATEHHLNAETVLALKRRYNGAGPVGRALMEADYVWRTVCRRQWRNLPQLPALARAYRHSRGMALLTDARDWLGGWPMEFSSVPEVTEALAVKKLDLVKIKTGTSNTEYLFAAPDLVRSAGFKPMSLDQVAVARLPVLRSVSQLPSTGDYYIFGCAPGAELLAAAARRAGRPPAGYIDLFRNDRLAGLEIQRFDRFTADPDTLVVLSNSYVQENADRLWGAGYTNILNAHPLVVEMIAGLS